MAYRTYEEWSSRGRVVMKGEKASGYLTDGTAIFKKEQTTKVRPESMLRYNKLNTPDSWYMGDEYDYH